MLKSFLLITFRKIKGSGSLLPNILSLAVGMAACVLIYSYVSYELSFDKFHELSRDIYRLETVQTNELGEESKSAYTSYSLGEDLLGQESSIKNLTRLMPYSENGDAHFRMELEGKAIRRIYADKVFFSDNNFFEVFSFPIILGDPANVLSEPNTLLISVSHAIRIFGQDWQSADLIGSILKSGRENLNTEEFVISGVFENPPSNSHLQFDVLIASSSSKSRLQIETNRQRKELYTYLLLNSGQEFDNQRLKTISETDEDGNMFSFEIKNVVKIHSGEPIANQAELGANREMITFLIAIGTIILIMIWANYINSSLITSIYRIKEIGIRKLLGIKPLQLILTFLGESLLINMIGATLAMFLALFALKAIEVFDFIRYPLQFARDTFGLSIIFLLILGALSSLVTGIYPALLMSKMQPVESLRGSLQVTQSKYSNKSSKIIRSLLIIQLGIVILFVSAVYTVYKQLNYLENNNFSITKLKAEGVFPGILGADEGFSRRSLKLYNDLIEEGLITELETSNLYKGQLKNTYLAKPLSKPGLDSTMVYKGNFHLYTVDYEFFKNDSLAFLAGDNFSPLFSSDYSSVIVNESAMRAIGYATPEEAVNQLADDVNGFKNIIGIIRNEGKNDPPKVFKTGLRYPTYFNITLQIRGTSGAKIQRALYRLEKRLLSQFPYFYLLDEQYEDLYQSENEILSFFVSSNIIALLIAGIGLYSLSSFTTLKRNQEIGVRKVLGARTFDILLILYYDFGILMLYGALIAAPLIVWGTTTWLSTYTYKIGFDATLLIVPLFATVCFIASIVSTQCWRSARKNPVLILNRN